MGIFAQLSTLFHGSGDACRRISPQEARDLLQSNPTVRLLDVRTEWEHRGRRIPGSVLAPVTALDRLAPSLLPDKQAPVIVHCQSGVRSRQAANQLLAMGYETVFDLGGITGWPYATESG